MPSRAGSRANHIVQFYEDDGSLAAVVADFLADGLITGQTLIVIATDAHRQAFLSRLEQKGIDLARAQRVGDLVCLDAQETLSACMAADMPDASRFDAVVGGILENRLQPGRTARVYGEMVDVLWKDGRHAAALRLEELWNELLAKYPLSLLCGYSLSNFDDDADDANLRAVCRQHARVVPADPRAAAIEDRRALSTALLQEQARSLQQELAHRRELESALRTALAHSRTAEQELKDFVENASEGLHWADADGRVLWANQAELDMLGYAREEYVGHQISEFHVHPEVIEDILARLARHETIRDLEVSLRCKDGSIKYALINANVRWEDGKFIHTRCFTRDITDRRAAQNVSNRLAAIVQSSDDAIVSKDLNGVVRSWNPAAERMFGYSSAEAVGKSIRMIIPAERQAEEDEVLRRIQRGEIVDHFETRRLRKDGTEVDVSLTVSPVKDGLGRIIGASKIARDITLRRQIEIERIQLLEREQAARLAADSSNRIKDEFLAMLSHELRTPLNAILGWTQIATTASRGRDEVAAKAAVQRAIEVIERNALAQARLIDDLLDVSRVVSGKLELNTEIVDLAALMVMVAEGARPAAEAKSLDLRVRLDTAAAPVLGDAPRLQQIVWNLVSNAIKFTPKGGAIELSVERDGSQVALAVRDTGVGIEPEFLPHVFERFRQADTTTTRKFGGLGLGLAVVHYLVRAHGGTVTAKSPGKGFGATFIVTLPLASEVVNPDLPRPHTDRAVALEGVFALVVDDDPDARDLLRHMLQQRGAEITTAASVQEALSALERRPFDVLLADLGMPDNDGFELIAAIRNHSRPAIRELRTIAVTAYAGDDARGKTLAAGYDEYVPKPVALNALAGAIAQLLASQRA